MLRRASTKIAHNSTIPVLGASQDLKPLQNLIMAEKAVLVSLKKLSVDYFKASDALRTWGLSEGNDFGDILSASSSLLKMFCAALVEYASHGDFMRKQLKVIRTKEESLDNLKRCRRNARRKAKNVDKKLSKMTSDSKNSFAQKETLVHLQEEIRKMDAGVMFEETALINFKRTATKAWMGLKFGGLVECCQKGMIAGEFGKLAIAKILEETGRPGMPQRSSLSPRIQDIQVESLVHEADRYVNAVALSIIPSVRFRDTDEHDQESPNSPTSPVSSSEPHHQQPSTSTLRDGNIESNPPAMQPIRRRKGQPPETPPANTSSEYPYVPPYQPQPSQGTSSSSQSSPSESQQQPSSTSTLHGGNGTNLQPVRRRKGSSPETPVHPVNSLSEYPPNIPPYQPQPSQLTINSSLSQQLPSEPQLEPPSPTSTVRGSNESNFEPTKPFRKRKGHHPETTDSPVNSSEYVPPYQPQPSSQGTVHSSSSQSLPSSQQPGVNEGAVNGCAVHRGNTVHRNNTTTSRLPTTPVNTRQPTSSKSRYHSQDLIPSSRGRHPIGDDPSSTGTSHLTPNRFNEWSQPSEDSSGDALYGDEPPPSFHDALLAPVVGSRSEISLSSTVGHFSVRHATELRPARVME